MTFPCISIRYVLPGLLLMLPLAAVVSPATAAQLTLTWTDTSSNESGFAVERATGTSGTFSQVGTTGAGATSYADTTVGSGTTYCYRVRAFNTSVYSGYSNTACGSVASGISLAVVANGSGAGTVSSSPSAISCGSSCSASFPSGTVVTLTYSLGSGSTFGGWSGGGCSGTGTSCTVTVNSTITVTATFNAQSSPPSGGGSTAGLVAAYSFSNGSGSTVTDLSGNNNTGQINGASWSSSGRYGSAVSFNGSGYVTVPDAATLDFTSGMTLEAWVYPTTTLNYWATVIMKEQSGQLTYALYGGSPSNRPNFIFNVGNSASSQRPVAGNAGLPVNTWSHLAGTYDGGTQRIYVNGTLVASQSVSGAVTTSTGPLRIGGNSVWGEYFSGLIDEVRVYNRALSASEIQSDMNTSVASTPPPPPSPPASGLMASYSFNENTGSSAADRSGSGYTISLTGGAGWTAGKYDSAVNFNGTTAYGTVSSFPSLSSWTVSAWVKSPAAPSSAVASGPVHREANLQLSWNHPTPTFRGAAAVNVAGVWYPASFGALSANTWYYLAATYDGQTLNAYTNGVLVTSNPSPSGSASSDPNPLTFGKHAASAQFFQGSLDNVRIYNRALSLSEIQADMNNPL